MFDLFALICLAVAFVTYVVWRRRLAYVVRKHDPKRRFIKTNGMWGAVSVNWKSSLISQSFVDDWRSVSQVHRLCLISIGGMFGFAILQKLIEKMTS